MTRLIDAEELKNDISEKVCDKFVRWDKTITVAEFETFIRDVIDNADTIINCKGCKNNGNERMCSDCYDYSNFVWYEKRPQGKWIRYRDNPHQPEHIKCSNCGQYWSVADHDKTFDFCFKCGADMRKGGAE